MPLNGHNSKWSHPAPSHRPAVPAQSPTGADFPHQRSPPKADTRYLHPASLDTHFPSWSSSVISSFPLHQMQSVQNNSLVTTRTVTIIFQDSISLVGFFFFFSLKLALFLFLKKHWEGQKSLKWSQFVNTPQSYERQKVLPGVHS